MKGMDFGLELEQRVHSHVEPGARCLKADGKW
jgi:hypothetical protein